ncbi:DUF4846 domain-containing protein [Aureivirga sp. CE67]|uniref:DUF4846 domain-containing protein n=1 Tax=Aureivirga sp. CE67 TaxID=1788983 RepID=UPI0018C9D11C|nr:DUF4846 domain-containing protein [Aureivirga sp. CE67]
MKIIKFLAVSFSLVFLSCKEAKSQEKELLIQNKIENKKSIINPEGKTLKTRFETPEGFERIKVQKNSFGDYLQNLPLKPHGAIVKYYNSDNKWNKDVYHAVVDLKIGKKDLHQCADAVMRLRAEYLWNQKKYDSIHFNFTNGFRVDYSKWMEGNRIGIKGNKTWWKKSAKPSNTYENFWKYMEQVFTYAGTASLSKELKSVSVKDLKIGDVFIQGGFPGHAIIVVDVAINPKTKEKLFMLAQSYMPAQETQILQNLENPKRSPWYSLEHANRLYTPEWSFDKTDLKRFK